LPQLVEAAVGFLSSWNIEFSAVVPVPPTKVYRKFQPVLALANEIARTFKVPLLKNSLRKIKEIPELKNIYDLEERKRLLSGAFEASAPSVRAEEILLVDDLYRSGATMEAIAQVLLSAGALEVYAFAFTQTRIKR
jgi:predicted amidophosphoribosyltransferase